MKKVIACLLVLSLVFSCTYYLYKRHKDSELVDKAMYNDFEFTITDNYNYDDNVGLLSDDIKYQADSICQKYNAVAVQIAVIENLELKYTYEYGYADKNAGTEVISDTKFRVASLSKFVTDAVFMKLCDMGKASINADISDYLGFEVRNPYYPDVVITPSMLMSHTSTIVNSEQFDYSLMNCSIIPIEEILEYNSTFCMAEPGKYYYYSNFAVAILGAVCEKITGMHFNDLAREYFFEPLEIDASYLAYELASPELLGNIYGWEGLTVEEQMNVRPHETIGQTIHLVQGNLTVSAKDYAKFISMICAGGVTEKGERLLSENSINQMLYPRIYDEGLGSGFGTEENNDLFNDRIVYSHTGNAYGMHSTYVFDYETGDAVIILTSGASVEYLDKYGIYDMAVELTRLLFPQNNVITENTDM